MRRKVKEERKIFIHPSYGYGLLTNDSSGCFLKMDVCIKYIHPYPFSLDEPLVDKQQDIDSVLSMYSEEKLLHLGNLLAYQLGMSCWSAYKYADQIRNVFDITNQFDELIKNHDLDISNNFDRLSIIRWSHYWNQTLLEKEYANSIFQEFDKRDDNEIICIQKGKLYYQKIREGDGTPIEEGDQINITFRLLNRFGHILKTSENFPSPAPLDLERAMRGFREGVPGRMYGERGVLFIHPDFSGQDLRSFPFFRPYVVAEIEINSI